MEYLGLADLGKTIGDDVESGYDYEHDGDNHVDICLDLESNSEEDILEHGIYLELLCDEKLDNSVLYPPKGKPYGCRRQQIHLSKTVSRKYLMKWES